MTKDAAPQPALIVAAALSAAVAIMAGAFGAHGADSAQHADWLRTGSLYQLPHAVAALWLATRHPRIAWGLLLGAGLFAVALYAMALGAPRWFGAVTPMGGLVMIGAWFVLAGTALRRGD